MKGFLIFSMLMATGLALTLDTNNVWSKYKATHKKVYNRVEELKRKAIFAKNLQLIFKHNLEADLGLHSFRLGLTKFADLENHEFRRLNGYRAGANRGRILRAIGVHTSPKDVSELPSEVDWRDKNLVVDVKDQGQCGSCWAFSAVASLEGQHAKKTGQLVSLSEQQLVDCSNPSGDPAGNQGCNGGLMNLAFEYIKEAGGLESEEDYPYSGTNDECKFDKSKIAATLTGYVNVTVGDESALQDAVANVGPVSVAIDAGSIWFQLYFGGVYDHDDCGSEMEQLNHGVTVVGYGSEDGKDYWLVKNSWGGSWGSSGYIKMRRNGNNQCGIATDASYPLV